MRETPCSRATMRRVSYHSYDNYSARDLLLQSGRVSELLVYPYGACWLRKLLSAVVVCTVQV